jgi:hypothetical protein
MLTPEETLRLEKLGKNRKLWTVDIIYSHYSFEMPQNDTKHMVKGNMELPALQAFIEKIFRTGFTLPIDSDHWRVIKPLDILQVDIFRQSDYFPDRNTPVISV